MTRKLTAAGAALALAGSGLLAAPLAGAAPTGLELLSPAVDPTQPRAESLTVAYVSDIGGCGWGDGPRCDQQWAVADMVRSWNPDYILTGGDNSQQEATEDQVVRSLQPYKEEVARGDFFYPIFGNHDFGNSCDAEGAKYSMQYWQVPLSYRAVLGNGLVEWFNPNGACQTSSGTSMPAIYDDYVHSVQTSEAAWQLTGVHQPPYSSGKSGNNINRRWTLQPEVDLVFSGHDHHSEFVVTPEGDHLVVNGTGGDGTTGLYTPTQGSQFRQNEYLGASRLTITEESLRHEFVNLAGETMYEFTLRKDADGNAYVAEQSEWTDPADGSEPGSGAVPTKREVSLDVPTDSYLQLTPIAYPDGPWEFAEVDGRRAIQLLRNPNGGGNHLYLQIADEAMSGGPYDMEAEITYRSDVAGSFVLQHDSSVTGAAYQASDRVTISSDQVGQWQTATIPLPAVNFNNRQNGSSDLRLLGASNLPLAVSALTIRSTVAEELVSVSFDAGEEPDGLAPIEYPSGPFSYVDVDGARALRIDDRPDSTTNNLYLGVDDRRIVDGPHDAWLTLTYRAEEPGRFRVQYDNADTGSAYHSVDEVLIGADAVGQWHTTTIPLPSAMFQNRQNGSADLRLVAPGSTNLLIQAMRIDLFDPEKTQVDPVEPGPGEDPTDPGTPAPSTGEEVSWTATNPDGIDPIPYESGPFSIVDLDGERVLQVETNPVNSGNNLYVGVTDSRLYGGPHHVWFSIEYRSPVEGSFVLQYDDAATGTAYHSAPAVQIGADDVDQWHTAVMELPAAMFQNRQNGDADFRLRGSNNLPFLVRSMAITFDDPTVTPEPEPEPTPTEPTAEPPQRPTARPTSVPSGKPTVLPSGRPSETPPTIKPWPGLPIFED